MRTPTIALLCMLMIAPFAGCFDAGTPDSTGSPSPTDDGSTLPTDNATANTPPTIAAKILVNGTEVVLENDTYAVPSAENITFDANMSSDAESQNLTFAWDFGDGNTSSESVAVYAYSAAGNVTVNLTVTDVDGASSSASFALVVATSGPPAGTDLGVEKKTFTGSFAQTADPACGDARKHPWDIATIDAATGATVLITHLKVVMTGSDTNIDSDLEVYGADGKLIKASAGATGDETVDLDGEWPAGMLEVRVKGCIAVAATYSIVAEATRVAA